MTDRKIINDLDFQNAQKVKNAVDGSAPQDYVTVAQLAGASGSVDFGTPAPTWSTVDAIGSSGKALQSDATFALFLASLPSTQAFGDSAAAGTVAFPARLDHKHAMPANPVVYATPSVGLGTAAAAGTATTLIRSDSTVAAFDGAVSSTQAFGDAATAGTANFGTPAPTWSTVDAFGASGLAIQSDATFALFNSSVASTQAFGDAATAGTVAFAARVDHKHAMPATPVGAEVAYTEFTSPVAPTATTEATANTVVTAGAFTADGTSAYLIEFFATDARPDAGAAARTLRFWLYDGSSSIGQLGFCRTQAAQNANWPVKLERRLIPSSGSKTYSIRADVSAGTGSISAGAGGASTNMPGFIRITKVT